MKKISLYGMAILFMIALGACNNGGKSSKERADSINNAQEPMPTDEGSDFMTSAAIGGMMEVKMGNVAQQHATSARVKAFANMMVTDHSRLNGKLKMLAQDKNVALPDSLDQNHQSDLNDLRNTKPSDFDKDYIDDMVKDHKQDINDFQKAANKVTDASIKSFITESLPVLQMHLDSAQAIQESLK